MTDMRACVSVRKRGSFWSGVTPDQANSSAVRMGGITITGHIVYSAPKLSERMGPPLYASDFAREADGKIIHFLHKMRCPDQKRQAHKKADGHGCPVAQKMNMIEFCK